MPKCRRTTRPSAFAVVMLLSLAPALAKDLPGGKDHPLVGRYDGAQITSYEAVAFDEQHLLNAPVDLKADGEKFTDGNSLTLEGKVTRIRYDAPKDRSALEIMRNYEDALKAKGFELLYACAGANCMKGPASPYRMSAFAGDGAINYRYGDGVRYLLARAARPTGDVYAAIYVGESRSGPLLHVIVVEEKPVETGRIAFVDADAMTKALSTDGRVALYGIQFDFDKADIKAESQATLDEITKLLKADPALSLVVTGHTDAKGAFDYNVDLSRRRATAVVEDLKRRGIAPPRLTPFGAGMAAPIAPNDDDAGRAKNRRVELVKR
ncbi:OmpA family protein [Xanthobacter agilis]|uniref:Outer membrane protein OmpA-like peptidoglycan-associated protein n=1 Tax=Xanthobacter agilis TaxID=47492 RepID=A0ABU0LD63_XANAG|nr:OmpA family protein [Xanthobacter agilis]MDQ0505090.1 outer membrane protein OmpA-like peptidoglycan-associated protein [Xanthobacter agilis]